MRILYTAAFFLPEQVGGVEVHLADLAGALRRRGDEVRVFCTTRDPSRPEYALDTGLHDGIPVTRIERRFSDATSFDDVWRSDAVERAFETVLDEVRPDILHVHHLTCLSLGLPAIARRRGVTVVMTLHDFWMGCPRGQRIRDDLDPCPPPRADRCLPCLQAAWPAFFAPPGSGGLARDLAAYRRYRAALRASLSSCDALVTPSHAHARAMAEGGVPANRLRVVPNGIRLDRFRDPEVVRRRREREAARDLRLGFLGTVIPSKGLHVLLDALGDVKGAPGEVSLQVHGPVAPFDPEGRYARAIRARAERDPRIRLQGPYEPGEVARILAGLDVVVVPSLWPETFGLTLHEAAASGACLVASRLGALAEAIEDGGSGLLVPPGDPRALGEVLEQLRRDPSRRLRLARAPHPSRDTRAMAEDLRELYADVRRRFSAASR